MAELEAMPLNPMTGEFNTDMLGAMPDTSVMGDIDLAALAALPGLVTHERTCFCAIEPARREEYVEVLRTIVRPGGLLLACFYPLRDGGDGPPFPVSRGDIERALAGRFTVLRAGPPGRSAERRQGLEWLVEARRG
jgi:hypothetical protein